MNICYQFFTNVVYDFYQILQFDIIPGITIMTLFFYCLLASSIFTVFTRR